MKYKVYQSFERLGYPLARVFNDKKDAVEYATELWLSVSELVQELPVSTPCVWIKDHERQVWEEANRRTTSGRYEWEVAAYVATEAVQLEEIKDEDC